jgi:predicted Zn-dependent peptidase
MKLMRDQSGTWFRWGGLLLAASLGVTSALAQKVPVVEKKLANGMRLLMVERHDEPSVSGGWVAHVGSSNERPGITGTAHLFEHMMFKGTPTIGTKDYQKDLQIITEQEKVREEMRAEEAVLRAKYRRGEIDDPQKLENKTPRWRELEKRFQELIKAQREVLVKNEFDRVYTSNGGSGMNAFTSQDMTAYFITVPANKIELWMWMESERLLHPVFREFYAERDVVYEERRMRTESTPLGKFEEEFMSMVWQAHPYHWPVIGWSSDVSAISKAQADEFYATYYAPQNLTAILVGDFKADEALALAEKYLGRIPRGIRTAPDVLTLEPAQPAEKRMLAEADTNPQVEIVWHSVPFGHADSYALQVLAQLLNGRTGRFYKGLVLKKQVATSAAAGQESMKWSGMFYADGEARDGHTPEEVEQALYAELEQLQQTEVPAEELQKVKNNFAANEYRKLSSNSAILHQIIFTDGLGDWREINEAGPKIQAVTSAEVKRVAAKYLTQENRTVAVYKRKPGAENQPEDPALAALSAEQKPMAKKMVASLQQEKDVAKLKQQLQQVETRGAQADEKVRPMLEFYKKSLAARIAELEKNVK